MTRKKGKLMTFLWSLIPGAGEMYLGFFKTGVSLMATFVILLSLSGFLQLNVLSLLSPFDFIHCSDFFNNPGEQFAPPRFQLENHRLNADNGCFLNKMPR